MRIPSSSIHEFNFKWICKDELSLFKLKPDFLADHLFKKDEGIKHIICKKFNMGKSCNDVAWLCLFFTNLVGLP